MNFTKEQKILEVNTTLKMSWPGAEWKYVLEGGMGQCVMTPGTMKMPLWSADSWDSHNMVSVKLYTQLYY